MCAEPRLVHYMGRRILCHPNFRLVLASREHQPSYGVTIASSVSLVNYGTSPETLRADLLNRLFMRLRPELYSEKRLAKERLQLATDNLHQTLAVFRQNLGVKTVCEKKQLLAQLNVDKVSQAMRNIREASVWSVNPYLQLWF